MLYLARPLCPRVLWCASYPEGKLYCAIAGRNNHQNYKIHARTYGLRATEQKRHAANDGGRLTATVWIERHSRYSCEQHTSIKRSLKDDMSTGMDHTVKRMRPKKSRATNRDDTLRLASCRASIASILQVIVLEVREVPL